MENNFDDLRYAELILKDLRNTISEDERRTLNDWLLTDTRHQQLYEKIKAGETLQEAILFQESIDQEADWESILARSQVQRAGSRYLMPVKIAAAAVALIAVGMLTYKLLNRPVTKPKSLAQVIKPVVKAVPGSNIATLQLGNGKEIQLGSQTGVIQEEDGTNINQQHNGLQYHKGQSENEEIIYNTLTTPRGGQFQITLEDGTRVWLNAASSLRFPVHFSKTDRVVELSGEGYFEVAKDNAKPFKVRSGQLEVQVLGTGFNIGAYTDEVKTTLVSGAVRIALKDKRTWQLKPGQEAALKNSEVKISKADIEKVIAWKEGLFFFRNDNFKEIMGQIARWYDVTVVYESGVPVKGISGNISRQASLDQALEMLSFVSGAHFKVKGSVITVK